MPQQSYWPNVNQITLIGMYSVNTWQDNTQLTRAVCIILEIYCGYVDAHLMDITGITCLLPFHYIQVTANILTSGVVKFWLISFVISHFVPIKSTLCFVLFVHVLCMFVIKRIWISMIYSILYVAFLVDVFPYFTSSVTITDGQESIWLNERKVK